MSHLSDATAQVVLRDGGESRAFFPEDSSKIKLLHVRYSRPCGGKLFCRYSLRVWGLPSPSLDSVFCRAEVFNSNEVSMSILSFRIVPLVLYQKTEQNTAMPKVF